MRAHKFRLYPSREIEQKMLNALDLCRKTYNELLGLLNEQKEIDKAQIQGIIPDIDLAKFGEKVTSEGKVGYTFSRKQAVISRKSGRLYLKALGSARTMRLLKQEKDWKTLKQNEEIEIFSGDRVRFGGTEGYIIFEIAEI